MYSMWLDYLSKSQMFLSRYEKSLWVCGKKLKAGFFVYIPNFFKKLPKDKLLTFF